MLMRFRGDREQGQTPRQPVFATIVGPGEMMMGASRVKPAKVTEVVTTRD
jgi:hypothetical protein